MDFIAPSLVALTSIIAAIFAYRGSKDSDSTERLSKAAGLYSDYAEKMENRVTAVEEKNLEIEKRLETSEKESEQYKKEALAYRNLILEVIQWITELLDWEAREYKGPEPRFTLTAVLTHLTNFVRSENSKAEDKVKRNVRDGN